ncbi:MAG: hypothetical protein ACRKFN_00930 [Desulfitobacterium sp.]
MSSQLFRAQTITLTAKFNNVPRGTLFLSISLVASLLSIAPSFLGYSLEA